MAGFVNLTVPVICTAKLTGWQVSLPVRVPTAEMGLDQVAPDLRGLGAVYLVALSAHQFTL